MSNVTILWLCLIAIVVCIVTSFKWKINMGIMSMAFAFIIGCLFQGVTAAKVFNYWPNSLVFFFIASNLFFGFARENGTLDVFGRKVLYKFRNACKILPIVFYFIAAILAFLGAGPGTIVLLAPIGYAVCSAVGIDPLLMAFMIDMGYSLGNFNPWTGSGVVLLGLVESAEGDALLASQYYLKSFIVHVLRQLILGIIFYVFYTFIIGRAKGKAKGQTAERVIEKPEDFTSVQKKTLTLIVISCILLVVPSILSTFVQTENMFFNNFVNFCKPQALCVVFALVASLMKLGSTKKVVSRVPINTILLISGVTFLMEIAKAADLNNVIVNLFGGGIPTFLVAPLFCLIAAFLSLFSAVNSVVLPLMYPLVSMLAVATGVSPISLYAAATIGSLSTAFSPWSAGGSQFIAVAPTEIADDLVKRQFVAALICGGITILLTLVGICNIFG